MAAREGLCGRRRGRHGADRVVASVGYDQGAKMVRQNIPCLLPLSSLGAIAISRVFRHHERDADGWHEAAGGGWRLFAPVPIADAASDTERKRRRAAFPWRHGLFRADIA